MASDINTVGDKESRTLKQEEKDFEDAVKRRTNVNLEEWPNDAGVCPISLSEVVKICTDPSDFTV